MGESSTFVISDSKADALHSPLLPLMQFGELSSVMSTVYATQVYDPSGSIDARFGDSLYCTSSGSLVSALNGPNAAAGAAVLSAGYKYACVGKRSE